MTVQEYKVMIQRKIGIKHLGKNIYLSNIELSEQSWRIMIIVTYILAKSYQRLSGNMKFVNTYKEF